MGRLVYQDLALSTELLMEILLMYEKELALDDVTPSRIFCVRVKMEECAHSKCRRLNW